MYHTKQSREVERRVASVEGAAPIDVGPNLTPLSVRFRDRELERSYIVHSEQAEGMRDRCLLLFGAVIYFAYGGLDLVVLDQELAKKTITIRTAGASFMVFMTWLSLQSGFRKITSYLLATAMFATGQQVAWMVHLVDDLYMPYYVGLLNVAVFYMAFGRTNFIIGAAVLSSFYLAFAVSHWDEAFTKILFSSHFFLAGTIATAILSVYFIERARRVQFYEMSQKKTYANELRHMMDEAEIDLARKNAVFNVIGHVVRTPVHQMIGFSQILGLKEPGDRVDQDDAEYVKEVESAGRTLLNEIKRLGDYMRLSSGASTKCFVRHRSSVLLADAIADLQAEVEASRCKIALEPTDIILFTDGQAVVRGLSEIVRNAIQNGASAIRITCTAFLDDAILTIQDDGPGIAPETMKFIDDPLAKRITFIDVGSDRLQLGVALAHRLAESAGGRLHFSSMQGYGTLAVFRLPVHRPAEPVSEAS